MATLDDSPSLFSGQSWSHWIDCVQSQSSQEEQSEPVAPNEDSNEDSTMKLRKEDMGLYGLCPAQDEFYLVVCECCGQVIKPQALQRHMEQRHGMFPRRRRSSGRSSSESSSVSPRMKTEHSPVKSSSAHSKTHSHTSSSHKSMKKPNSNPPVSHSKSKQSQVSKCKKTAVVKVERMQPTPAPSPKKMPVKSSENSHTSEPSSFKEPIPAEPPDKNKDQREVLGKFKPIFEPPTKIPKKEFSPVSGKTHQASLQVDRDEVLDIGTKVTVKKEQVGVLPTTVVLTMISPSTSVITPITAMPAPSLPNSSNQPHLVSVSTVNSNHSLVASNKEIMTNSLQKTATSVAPVAVVSVTKKLQPPALSSGIVTTSASVKVSSAYTATSSSVKRAPPLKEKKVLKCIDRQYDCDRHCGVWLPELSRQCTRSLTCKTHALSLRRAVQGRSDTFDELLKAHKEAKEADLKAKAEANGVPYIPKSSNAGGSSAKSKSTAASSKSAPVTPVTVPCSPFKLPTTEIAVTTPTLVSPPPMLKTQTSTPRDKSSLSSSFIRQSSLPHFPKFDAVPLVEPTCYLSSEGEEEEEEKDKEYSCINHHPRPAVVNSFGAWRHGGGCYVFNRKEDLYRAAFFAAVDRHLHPPPHKKLCVESNLPKGSTMSTSTTDPYEFSFGEHSSQNLRRASLTSRLPTKGSMTKPKPGSVSSPTSGSKCSLSGLTSPGQSSSFNSSGSMLDLSDTLGSPPGLVTSTPSAKRKRSGSSPVAQRVSSVNNGTGMSTLIGSSNTGTITSTSPLSLTIPASISFNLSSSTLSNINANFAVNKLSTGSRSPIDKDPRRQSLDSNTSSQVNGQLVSISSPNMAEMTHIQLNSLSEKCAKAKNNKNATKSQNSRNSIQSNTRTPIKSQSEMWGTDVTYSLSRKTQSSFSANNSVLGFNPMFGSTGSGGFLHLDTPLSNTSLGVTNTASSASSGSVSSTQPSPVQLSSPILPSGASSPSSPLANGLLSPSGLGLGKMNSKQLTAGDNLTTNINLALTEQLLAQHPSSFPLSTLKTEGNLQRGLMTSSMRTGFPAQVTLSAKAATAQQLAAAALNLNPAATFSLSAPGSGLLTANDNMPQVYATHVLAKSSGNAPLASLQLQAKPGGQKGVGPSQGKVPLHPLSLRIVAPGATVTSSQHHQQQQHMVLHTTDNLNPHMHLEPS